MATGNGNSVGRVYTLADQEAARKDLEKRRVECVATAEAEARKVLEEHANEWANSLHHRLESLMKAEAQVNRFIDQINEVAHLRTAMHDAVALITSSVALLTGPGAGFALGVVNFINSKMRADSALVGIVGGVPASGEQALEIAGNVANFGGGSMDIIELLAKNDPFVLVRGAKIPTAVFRGAGRGFDVSGLLLDIQQAVYGQTGQVAAIANLSSAQLNSLHAAIESWDPNVLESVFGFESYVLQSDIRALVDARQKVEEAGVGLAKAKEAASKPKESDLYKFRYSMCVNPNYWDPNR